MIPPTQIVLDAIEKVESNNQWWVVSKSGCIGLMQICPRYSSYKRSELFIPEINREEGARMLASWLRASHGNMTSALAAYRYGYSGLYGKRGRGYARIVLKIAREKWILQTKEGV